MIWVGESVRRIGRAKVEASLVLTILGPDRPGLVEAVSQTIAKHGGSWQESRMARLAGRFAGVLLVTVDESHAAALSEALLLPSVSCPKAALRAPVLLTEREPRPNAAFSKPALFSASAPHPKAALLSPVVLPASAVPPNAEL